MLAGSVALMAILYQPGRDPSRVYYGTDTRAQSLLVGALLAMLMLDRPVVRRDVARVALQVAGLVAAAGLAVMWVTFSDHADQLYRGGFLLEAVLVAVVIASVVQPRPGPLGALLSVGWIRWIGQISYGLYLYHWPVFITLDEARTGLDGYALFAVRLAVTFGIATALVLPGRGPHPEGHVHRCAASARSCPVSRSRCSPGSSSPPPARLRRRSRSRPPTSRPPRPTSSASPASAIPRG